jgi:DNA-binding GntR family transcriptional regulator
LESQKLHDWLQVIGIAAVVASLIFVGLQIKQSDEIALAEILESVAARAIEERALIAANADTWQKACLGEMLTAHEELIAANIYMNYLQNNFNSWVRFQETGIGGTGSGFLTDAYAANIHRYPGFKQMALSFADWGELGARFDGELAKKYRNAVLQRVRELEELEPDPSADVRWCGVR